MLCRLGADESSQDAVTIASDGTAPESSLHWTVEMSSSSECIKRLKALFLGELFCQLSCLGCQPVSTVCVCELVCFVIVHGALWFVEVTASEVASVQFRYSKLALSYLEFKQI